MTAQFGFKTGSAEDNLAITGIIGAADSVKTQQYETLAQYEILQVRLRPTNISFDMPRKWLLGVTTQLRGFNQPDGKAVYFNPSDPLQDRQQETQTGYTEYPLTSSELANMIKGGLADNPEAYMSRLSKSMAHQSFYRQSRVNLTSALVKDSHLDIQVGDFSPKTPQVKRYLIGSDLNAFHTFPDTGKSQTNLPALLDQKTTLLVHDPVKQVRKTAKVTTVFKQSLAQESLGKKTTVEHVDDKLALSAHSDIAQTSAPSKAATTPASSAVPVAKQPATSSASASASTAPASASAHTFSSEFADADTSAADSATPQPDQSDATLSAVAQTLASMASDTPAPMHRPVHHYHDDFAQANQASQVARRKKQQGTATEQQHEASSADDGLSR